MEELKKKQDEKMNVELDKRKMAEKESETRRQMEENRRRDEIEFRIR